MLSNIHLSSISILWEKFYSCLLIFTCISIGIGTTYISNRKRDSSMTASSDVICFKMMNNVVFDEKNAIIRKIMSLKKTG